MNIPINQMSVHFPMSKKYQAVPLRDLINLPNRVPLTAKRARLVADLLTKKLDQMSNDGWELVTSWKSASGTIFVFATNREEQS